MEHPPRDRRSASPHRTPFQPAVRRDIGDVEGIEARTRDFLARFIALASGAAVGSTGAYGAMMKDYRALTTIWAGVGPVMAPL